MRNVRLPVRLTGWITLAATLSLAACGGSSDGSASAAPRDTVATRSSTATTQTTTWGTTSFSSPATRPVKPRHAPPPPPPTPTTSSATLTWLAPTENTDGTPLTNLGGFRIYYGTNPAQLTSTIALSNPGLLIYMIEGLPVGTTYYFAIRAVTSSGIEGTESAVVSTLIA